MPSLVACALYALRLLRGDKLLAGGVDRILGISRQRVQPRGYGIEMPNFRGVFV